MGQIKDITNQKFNRLTALKFMGLSNENKALWLCRCDCGNEKIVSGKALRVGSTKSCGCQKRESTTKRNTTHGGSETRLYTVWRGMKARCDNPNSTAFSAYGGRGITVCDEWHDSFGTFREWAHKNGYREGLSIERINVDKGYSPDNCTWIPLPDQGINKRSTKWVTVNGLTKTMSGWARTLGIEIETIFKNERKGIDVKSYIEWKLEHKGKRHPAFKI